MLSRVPQVMSIQSVLQHLDSPSFLFSEHILQTAVMKKEVLYLHVEPAQVKEKMLRDFQECIDADPAARASFMRTSGIR